MAAKSEKITFEASLSRLEEIASELEGGTVSLDKSLDLYNEGIKLIKSANTMLDNAEKKIKLAKKDGEDAE